MKDKAFTRSSEPAKAVEKPAKLPTYSVSLEPEVHSLLAKAAPKHRLKMGQFANAAIRYFIENGLDPTKSTVLAEGAKTRVEVSEASHKIRQHTTDIGNQLAEVVRSSQAETRDLLATQQRDVLSCLEQIQAHILAYHVAVEKRFLTPLLEQVLRINAITDIGQYDTAQVLLKLKNMPAAAPELAVVEQKNTMQALERYNYLMQHLRAIPLPKADTTLKLPSQSAAS